MSEVKVNKISPRIDCGTVTVGDAGDSVTVTAGVPVTVNGDLKSNALKAVDGGSIISQCGTTITLGASGDTINLACGASQTGFGRTGTVDWDTTAKTANFTAVSGVGYFVNTTSGAVTVTLPATPSANDIVAIADYAGTAATNNITIARNGSPIEGSTIDGLISTNRQTATFIYIDGTQGWVVVNSNDQSFNLPLFITATGGTITCCGDYKIHTFTSPGTFTVTCAGNAVGSNSVDYLVVAGGGGGGTGSSHGAGGGAGGFRESSGAASGCYTTSPLGTCVSSLPVTAQGYPITVGGGGAGATSTSPKFGADGNNSIFSTITSTGGGAGGGWTDSAGRPGGSGSGAACSPTPTAVGAGNTPPVSPPQGNPGGPVNPNGSRMGGGGGAGEAGNTDGDGFGGDGVQTAISASATFYAGGGGAGGSSCGNANKPGGDGGGGTGSGTGNGGSGTVNTGGGGGGSYQAPHTAGSGGSGIVIIRYKYQ